MRHQIHLRRRHIPSTGSSYVLGKSKWARRPCEVSLAVEFESTWTVLSNSQGDPGLVYSQASDIR